jgi:hypothetical protein
MKTGRVVLLIAVTAFACASPAAADTVHPASASLVVGGSSYAFTPRETSPGTFVVGQGVIAAENFRAELAAVPGADRSVSYSLAVTNFLSTPASYALTLAIPVDPVIPTDPITPTDPILPPTVSASIVGTLTDVAADGVFLSPSGANDLQTSFVGPRLTNIGVDVGDGFSAGPTNEPTTYAWGPAGTGPRAGPVGRWDELLVRTRFTPSANDRASVTGFARIVPDQPVPLPPAAWGGLALLAGTGLARRLRHRRHAAAVAA